MYIAHHNSQAYIVLGEKFFNYSHPSIHLDIPNLVNIVPHPIVVIGRCIIIRVICGLGVKSAS